MDAANLESEKRLFGELGIGKQHNTKQRATDISNLRFYSAMAHDLKWQTDTIHWSVISKTLQEIADRLAAE